MCIFILAKWRCHGYMVTTPQKWYHGKLLLYNKQTNRQTDDAPPTSGPGCFVIWLADQLLVIHQIKFITSRKLSWADEAGKALKVVHIFLGPSNNLSGRDRLCTTCTASPKLPVRIKKRDQKRSLKTVSPLNINCENLMDTWIPWPLVWKPGK